MKPFLHKIGQALYRLALRIRDNPIWPKWWRFSQKKYALGRLRLVEFNQRMTDYVQPRLEKLARFITRKPEFKISRRFTQILFYIAVYLVLSFVWNFISGFLSDSKARDARNRPVSVVTSPIERGDITVIQTALGTVTPRNVVTVRTQVSGILSKLYFREGDLVKAGQLLAQVDPRPFEAALKQAQGTLDKDQALLSNAETDLKRYDILLKQDSISKQVYATQKALVQQYKGNVLTDEGSVSAAKLQLEFSHITSPINGRIGLRFVDPGNLVQPSDASGLFVITQLQPTTVLFSVPQEVIPAFKKFLEEPPPPENAPAPAPASAPTASNGTQTSASPLAEKILIPVEAWSSDNKVKLATGFLESIDNEIDITTGTVKLRGIFANENLNLFPNQFVNVRVVLETLKNTLVIPVPAIQRGTPGTFVYRLNNNNTVSVVPVKLGPIDGYNQQVLDGLSAGNIVVVDGTDKLRNGSKVMVGKASSAVNPDSKSGWGSSKKSKRAAQGN
ncbi:efflux RND transporter periplasmic adaptor subunit [Polynucleobacter sp. UK-Gri1-W3]|uniref:efflux RND transporter periplasmic adaptor subunit n=1 Tax=Polynucleobacter sp. UK-Gri1-W3 TaxID=1819737 RepID=UPI001C0E3118|nr:efflux RND transporter periplasmic adaptor subunit [Polynucleobacter sp. UK-Gri1-W3]MBU3539027.1 efflux RND transporter periplasmic adaptor subunit [Polynucleobacter sp. UK-Gri1-W3]